MDLKKKKKSTKYIYNFIICITHYKVKWWLLTCWYAGAEQKLPFFCTTPTQRHIDQQQDKGNKNCGGKSIFIKTCRIISFISVLPSYELTVHGVRTKSLPKATRQPAAAGVKKKISVTMPALHHGFSFGGVETRRSRWSAVCEAPGEAWRWFTSSECTHAVPQEDSDSPRLSLICVTKKTNQR